MRERSFLSRLVISAANAAVFAVFLALIACGSSGNTFTSPSALSKCAVSFDAPGSTLPAAGGTAAISVKTERECQWTAQPDVGWLTITAGTSGQGDGTVQVRAAANGDPVARTGGVMLNGQRAQLSQAAADCAFSLSDNGTSVPQAGGSGRVDVRASSALCTWTAASEVDWVTITSGTSGRGSAPVSFNAAPTTGPPRTGSLTIAGLHFNVTQAEGCTYAIAPNTFSAGAGGGSSVVTITAGVGCPWTAASNVPWVTITSGAAGSGPGTVAFNVAPTDGPSRTGTLTIAGQEFTVTQTPGCTFDVTPLNFTPDQSGGARVLNVTTGAGCAWTASSNAPWLTITSGAAGSGPGSVNFNVAATDGPARTGTLTVAGQTVTVTQAPGCSVSVSPLSHTADPSGGPRSVTITAGAGCAWSAASNASWLKITSATSGTGSGTLTFTIDATTGPARSGTLTIGGQTVTVTQGEGCTFGINPESQNVPASGGTGNVTVTAGGGCGWTAKSNDQWLTITSSASGTGNGTVSFRAASTNGPGRSGTLTIAEQTFTVTQGQGCSFSLSASSASEPAGGGTGEFDMRSADGCSWRAESNASWLTVTSGGTGSGDGTIRYSAAANTGPQRTGVITAGGQRFTVTQAGGCDYSISPPSQNVGSGAGSATVTVTAPGGCSWEARSNADWIHISSGASGSGNGTVQLAIDANTGGDRSGTVTVAGQTFTVVQGGGCTFSLAPPNQNVPPGGGTGSFSVNTAGGCAWTATVNPNAPWIGITSAPGGNGPGTVQFSAAANTGPARSGTITAGGQTFTVTQDGGCSATVAPDTINAPASAGSQNVNITTPAECSWEAVSQAPWIGITVGARGSGNGTSQLDIQANTGPARTGTALVAGRTVTVNQASGCAITISPQSQPFPVAGGSGTVTVDASGGCDWTAVSNNPDWIRITEGERGSGGGSVRFTVDANATGAPRTGTITISNQTFTVDQAGTE